MVNLRISIKKKSIDVVQLTHREMRPTRAMVKQFSHTQITAHFISFQPNVILDCHHAEHSQRESTPLGQYGTPN